MVDVAQLVRASVCGTEGRGFESRLPPSKPDFSGFFFKCFEVRKYQVSSIGLTFNLLMRLQLQSNLLKVLQYCFSNIQLGVR